MKKCGRYFKAKCEMRLVALYTSDSYWSEHNGIVLPANDKLVNYKFLP